MPTESSPLGDGAKIDLTEAPNATVQKPFPEQSRPETELTHQFFDPNDAGCIKAAANGTILSGCGSSPQKDFVAATKHAMLQEFGKEAASKKGVAILGDLGATKERAKIGSVHKPLSLGDSEEENVEDDGEEEDVSSEEESVEEEEEEYDEEDEEDEEQGVSEEDKDGHDDLGEPPAKRKK